MVLAATVREAVSELGVVKGATPFRRLENLLAGMGVPVHIKADDDGGGGDAEVAHGKALLST